MVVVAQDRGSVGKEWDIRDVGPFFRAQEGHLAGNVHCLLWRGPRKGHDRVSPLPGSLWS